MHKPRLVRGAAPVIDGTISETTLRPEFLMDDYSQQWLRAHGSLDALPFVPGGSCIRDEMDLVVLCTQNLVKR